MIKPNGRLMMASGRVGTPDVKAQSEMDFIEIGRAVGALLLILGLIGAAGLAARRYGLPGLAKPVNKRRLTLVETLAISPRQKICIVKCDDAEHLVVVGESGAAVIVRDLPKPKPSAASVSAEPAP